MKRTKEKYEPMKNDTRTSDIMRFSAVNRLPYKAK